MSAEIVREQDSDESIRLLGAQRHIYASAKWVYFAGILSALTLEVCAPFVILFFPDAKTGLELVGSLLAVVATLMFSRQVDAKVDMAARIQEEFDVNLFRLSWNGFLVDDKVMHELVIEAAEADKGDREDLKKWYPTNIEDIPYPVDVLLCQRASLVWDARLQRACAEVFAAIAWDTFSLGLLWRASSNRKL